MTENVLDIELNSNNTKEIHIPVLLEEVLKYLIVRTDGNYADFTFGMGGHSRQILKRIKDGNLIAFEWDKEQINLAKNDTFFFKSNFFLIEDNFINFIYHLKEKKIDKLDGVLLDLGLSSFQLKCFHRGLSFRVDAPLDMRLSCSHNSLTAEEVVNNYSADELSKIFNSFGEERNANKIAKKIVIKRKIKRIEKTDEFVSIIASCFEKKKKKHPARKVFQALRIFLNKELENLTIVLEKIFDYLEVNGRVIVISYNSLEDTIVKRVFRNREKTGNFKILNKKVITPTDLEVKNNNRSRSAKMRIIEKI